MPPWDGDGAREERAKRAMGHRMHLNHQASLVGVATCLGKASRLAVQHRVFL